MIKLTSPNTLLRYNYLCIKSLQQAYDFTSRASTELTSFTCMAPMIRSLNCLKLAPWRGLVKIRDHLLGQPLYPDLAFCNPISDKVESHIYVLSTFAT